MTEPAQPLNALTVAAVGKPFDRGQRRHRQDLDAGSAGAALRVGAWRRSDPFRPATGAFASAGDDLHPRRHPRVVRTHSRADWPQQRACLRGESRPDSSDSLLLGLLAEYPTGPARAEAAWRAAMAADAMDEAAVHTIDAWCQRMLREHAFDSGNLFDETLQPDERAITAEAGARLLAPADPAVAGGLADRGFGAVAKRRTSGFRRSGAAAAPRSRRCARSGPVTDAGVTLR